MSVCPFSSCLALLERADSSIKRSHYKGNILNLTEALHAAYNFIVANSNSHFLNRHLLILQVVSEATEITETFVQKKVSFPDYLPINVPTNLHTLFPYIFLQQKNVSFIRNANLPSFYVLSFCFLSIFSLLL